MRVVPELLRDNPQFRTFFAGQAISLVGDQITLIALPLVAVLALDATPAQMGYLVTAALLPNLLFSLHAGAWVDRGGRRRQVMIVADLGRAAALASVPIADAFGALTFAQLYAVGFATGLLSVFFYVSHSALFVALVRRERYVEGNSLLHGSRALSAVVGPSLGGTLVQLLTAPAALAVDACSFVASAWSLARIRPRSRRPRPRNAGTFRRHPLHRRLANAPRQPRGTATINLFNFVFFALIILYANRYLHVGPGALGLVLGLGALGVLLGAGGRGRVHARIGVGPTYLVGCIRLPLPLVLVPLAGGPRWLVLTCLFAAEFGSGLGVMLLDISSGSIMAALIPDGCGRGSRAPTWWSITACGRSARSSAACSAAQSESGRRCGSPSSAACSASSGCCPRRSRGCTSCRRPRSRTSRPPARSSRSREARFVQPLAFIP